MLESEIMKPLLCMKGRMAIDYIVDFGYRIALDMYF